MSRALMVQMEHWKTNPERGVRPLTAGGGALSIGSPTKFHKPKMRAAAFSVIAQKRAAQRRRVQKGGKK